MNAISTNIFLRIHSHKSCQDLSLAGRRAGMDVSQAEGGTRSGLLWEVERILTECKELGTMPNVLIMENVPQIHSEKDYPNFEKWQIKLEELGYVSYWADLNAKDFGIPQNRERTFMVSILGQDYLYKFPTPIEREHDLKDFLEDEVDQKYYLSQKMIDYLTGVNQKESKFDRGSRFEYSLKITNEDNLAACITTAAGQRPTDNFVLVREATEQGYRVAHEGDGINISSRMHHQRGNVQYGLAQTLKTKCEVGTLEFKGDKCIVRKLTEKECMRLMAFTDEDTQHLKEANITGSIVYHSAGDSLVVTIFLGILAKLYGLSNKEVEIIIKDYIRGIKNE